jgi:hypothetical protein
MDEPAGRSTKISPSMATASVRSTASSSRQPGNRDPVRGCRCRPDRHRRGSDLLLRVVGTMIRQRCPLVSQEVADVQREIEDGHVVRRRRHRLCHGMTGSIDVPTRSRRHRAVVRLLRLGNAAGIAHKSGRSRRRAASPRGSVRHAPGRRCHPSVDQQKGTRRDTLGDGACPRTVWSAPVLPWAVRASRRVDFALRRST